uniref:Putative group vii salivary lipocalin n=1 Tax=Rhipicephalus pulchellus TaxID=72859 RepID=L7M9N8_RHIPC
MKTLQQQIPVHGSRYISRLLGWNIWLLVVLLSCLPPVDMRFPHGYGPCNDGEHKLYCTNGKREEATCPRTLPLSCADRSYYCACERHLDRRADGECVVYRKCVRLGFFGVEFLKNHRHLYLLGVSKSVFRQNIVCMNSTFYWNSCLNDRCDISVHQVSVKAKAHSEQDTWKYETTELKCTSDIYYHNALLKALNIFLEYIVLHADQNCFIMGAKMPPMGSNTTCLIWSTGTTFRELTWECKFVARQYCEAPYRIRKQKRQICDWR